jgi:hypothetical protein
MTLTERNPRLDKFLPALMIIEALVLLVASAGLLVLTAVFRPIWPWTLTPFNAGFLGAIYAASLVIVAMLALNPRWSPARVVLPMIWSFTLWVLLMSLAYLSNFNLSLPSTWIWLILYVFLPVGTGYFLWKYRSREPVAAVPLSRLWRNLMMIGAALLMLYSLALIIVPAAATSFWPWTIDDFHARLYAAMFLAGAIGTWLTSRSAAPEELLVLGVGQGVFGALVLIELFIVDSQVHKVNWSLPNTWIWIVVFALIVGMGIAYVVLSRRSTAVTATATAD